MLRALWFFFQLAIVVSAAIWIASQKGAVQIEWQDYILSLNLGVFLLSFVIFTIIAMALFRIIGALVDIPNGYARYRKDRARAKGFRALTRGFVAIAAGDAKKATQYARDVRGYLPDEKGLPLLLEAQAARLRGEEDVARLSFEKLVQDKDAAFLGVRGLLRSSLDEGNVVQALSYARQALVHNPKQPWVLKTVYDLEIQNGEWENALRTLERVKKTDAIDFVQAEKDEAALLLLRADKEKLAGHDAAYIKLVEKAIKASPAFIPAITRLCDYYLSIKKNGKVVSLIEKVWKLKPHPALVDFWGRVAPENKSSDPLRRLRWFEKLTVLKPDSVYGQLAAAKESMDAGLWGEAKAYLMTAESLRPSAQVYRLRADLEEKTNGNPASVREWMEKAADAPADDVWHCVRSGHIYEEWAPIAEPYGTFNTIEWGNPIVHGGDTRSPLFGVWKDPLMIEKNTP